MPPRRRGRPGLMGTMARTAVIAGTATAVSKGVSGAMTPKPQAEPAAAPAPAPQAAPAPVAAAPAAPAPAADSSALDAKFAQLAKLGELKNAGVLTEEEFAAEKAKILA